MITKEEARTKVAELVERWRSLTPGQVRNTYQEANTRKDFVLGLFRALGWDTDRAEEVFEERKAGRGEVDYAFRIREISRFYLEAKPLRDELASHPEWVKQAVTYAYNKSIPYVVLTNFRDLWVYNGDVRPQRFLTLRADQYVDDFDLLWLLSKESTEQGLLEQEAEKNGALPPRVRVERRLYENLAEWRERLSRELHAYQLGISLALLDEMIQRLFNRLIFIRSCEDRRIEEPVLQPLARQFRSRTLRGSLWDSLKRVFSDFDQGYDSELFTPHVLDLQAVFQDDTLADVLTGLYGPPGGHVAYDFSVIDGDVLGRVYEQYLGHVSQVVRKRHQELQARLDLGMPQDQALAETLEVIQRPQRRRSQGIYYTPQWVVDYLVAQTVGRFIQEHPNRPDAIHDIRVLDMACGSGSFLIRAYSELLDFHGQGRPPEWVFSDERLSILRNSIFGVDLDPQAVEIARLNLLLRALRERQRLPELRENIKRGNSLISEGEPEKHPFDWDREFPLIMKEGGFDVVIGNPPYVRIQSLPRDEADYYRAHYDSAFGSFDLYIMFIEQGLRLLKTGGRLGFITSGKFLKAEYGKKLQQYIRNQATVEEIVDLSAQKVFADATTYPVMIVLQKGAQERELRYTLVAETTGVSGPGTGVEELATTEVGQSAIVAGAWPPAVGPVKPLLAKLENQSRPLGGLVTHSFQGLISGADDVFIVKGVGQPSQELVTVMNMLTGVQYELEAFMLHPTLVGSRHLQRWRIENTDSYLIFPYELVDESPQLMSDKRLEVESPRVWQYLLQHKYDLETREHGRWRGTQWYKFGRHQNLLQFLKSSQRILATSMAIQPSFAIDAYGKLFFTGGGSSGVYGLVFAPTNDLRLEYLAALLNSSLLGYLLKSMSSPFRGGYYVQRPQYLRRLPIRVLDLGKRADKRQHEGIVGLVEEMLRLQQRLAPLRGAPSEAQADLERRVAHVDRAIDEAVYALYGLTDAERRLVENET